MTQAKAVAKQLVAQHPELAMSMALEVVRLVAVEMAEHAKREALSHRPVLKAVETPAMFRTLVSARLKVEPKQLDSVRRTRRISQARAVVMWLCRTRLRMSFEEIGDQFEMDHTSVMSACKKIDAGLYPASIAHELSAKLDLTQPFHVERHGEDLP